jgi:3-dehydroquinate dehydratase/shikimate dehydrogenase
MQAICIPVFVKPDVNFEDLFEDLEDSLENLPHGAGMFELRCDQATPRLMLEAIDMAHLPVIVTVRPTWEGGLCDKDDEYRIGLWEAAIEAGVEFIDVELAAWERNKDLRDRLSEVAEKSGTKIILSNHAFDGRPKDLEQRLARLKRVKQADVLKLAWKAESILDAIEALKLMARMKTEDPRPFLAIAMGEEGQISRLLGKKFGAPFTFAAFDQTSNSAPGQPTVTDLRELYRWEELQADTPVMGVAGWPIIQSKSPAIHNAGLDAVAGVEGVYVPLAVRTGLLGGLGTVLDALRAVPGMNLRGVSVTIPHKEAAFKYVCDKNGKIDDISWRIGVLNTVLWNGDAFLGMNTDYEGALDALATVLGGTRDALKGKRVAVLGAGGAGRAVVAGLAAYGASITVYNKPQQFADNLAADFSDSQVAAGAWENLPNESCDIWINCTPVGMFPEVNACPITFEPAWTPGTVVFDVVYNPELTMFLKLALRKNAKIVKGTEMFVRQAAAQFKAFNGKDAPIEEFRRVLNEAHQ